MWPRRTSSLRFRTSIRLYHFPNNASKPFANGALKLLFPNKPKWELRAAGLKKMSIRYGSAHAAVGRPVHLGHLASDDISLETPATNHGGGLFPHDGIMTNWSR